MNGLNGSEKKAAAAAAADVDRDSIAIIGMSGRFPGAADIDALWRLVLDGKNAFSSFGPDDIEDAFTDEERSAPNYVPTRPQLEGVDLFDAEFFGMFPREAAVTDPQHRILLEICWEALEKAGYDTERYDGAVGVFAGSSIPTYLLNNVLPTRAKVEELTTNYQIGSFPEVVGSINDTLATRIAYKLKLRGPAFTIQSACSTSLLAVTQACNNLRLHNCDMALAGGVSVTLPLKRGYMYQEGGMVAKDGVCRPFDNDASGTVFAHGAGVVLLKRLADARRDGDGILAVIRGYGVNNDGAEKIGFTAPSIKGQAGAITAALSDAGVDPGSIGYVECHGTATPLGDPIEFEGLKAAFAGAGGGQGDCALGSLKGNIGHMDAAAGVCGLIKATLALRTATIPPMANFSTPNRHIDFDSSRFYVPTEVTEWDAGEAPRRAGVSSFGVGGTNVHVVVEEYRSDKNERAEVPSGARILPLSARSETAVAVMRHRLAQHLEENPDVDLTSVARTLQTGRREFAFRGSVVAEDALQAASLLKGEGFRTFQADATAPIVFMFPGQGAQYVGMGAGIYDSEPEFARWIDRGAEIVKMSYGFDPRDYICHAGSVSDAMHQEVRETRIAQPCLYLTEYALARLWLMRGLRPDGMIGHSVGEFAAATIANVMSFEDGLRLVSARGRFMQSQPAGSMVSVRASADRIEPLLQGSAEIAAINAPNLCVIAGTFGGVDEVCARLEAEGIAFSKLHTSHAFHSRMMDPVIGALSEEAARLTYGTASLSYVSSVSGDWQDDHAGMSPQYWAAHCREPVLFARGIQTICAQSKPILLEVGPGRTLSVFAAQTVGRDGATAIIQSMPEHSRASASVEVLLEAHGHLWSAGAGVKWPSLPAASGQRASLPSYPFQRQRHWIDAPPVARRAPPAELPPPVAVQAPASTPVVQQEEVRTMAPASTIETAGRPARLEIALLALLSDMSGENLGPDARSATFIELGFDSLFVGQFAQKLEKQYGVKISFRELLGNIPSVAALARHLDAEMAPDPIDTAAPAVTAPAAAPAPVQGPVSVAPAAAPVNAIPQAAPAIDPAGLSPIQALIQSQIQMTQALFAQQLQVLQSASGGAVAVQAPAIVPATPPATQPAVPASVQVETVAESADPEAEIGTDRIKLYKPGQSREMEISPTTRQFISDLVTSYEAKHRESKAFTEANRARLADPRTAAGFRADLKEIVFPIVADKSKGSRIWDIDGNEYIDLVNGFGQTAFGHAPDFVVDAVRAQLDKGFAIGPQTPIAGEVADLLSAMTGHERVTFCNTGSEAVMAAMRVARSVTGNDKIVIFANDYHGQFDEVLVKGRNNIANPVALPIASGIPRETVANMIVLQYGEEASLGWIRDNADSIAAVIIEPVQSRHPEIRPMSFVREIRDIATREGFALVFDEVVTGFRVDPGGMQAIWGIRGDMATYGKVLGGGMPIGVLAGDKRFMDALDGGHWNYGDDSVPMTAPTFFAGTFVRHPVVLAAARATLQHIKGSGSELYGRVAARTEALVAEINADMRARGIVRQIHSYKSWFVTDFSSDDPLGSLLYVQLRLNGIYIQDGYPCFLTTAHSEDDFRQIARAFRDSVDMLQSAGITLGATMQDRLALAEPPASDRQREAALTEAQSEIWLAAQLGDEASCSFNESCSLTLDGLLDQDALLRALETVVARHDALHIRFDRSGQRFAFLPNFRMNPDLVDFTDVPEQQGRLRDLIDVEASTPFDLVDGPLVRAILVRLSDSRNVLVFTAHHIVCDGFSMNVIMEELATAYSKYKRGEQPVFEPALSFADYAETYAPKASPGDRTEQFWIDRFREIPAPLDMPYDRAYPERRTFAGGTVTGWIDADTYKALKKRGAKAGATLFSTLLATLQVLVSRLSGQSDIVIAVPSAGQSLLDEQILVGHCVNLLPLRQTVMPDSSFESHLKTTQQTVLEAFEHQDYTYGTLIRKLEVKRDGRRLPLTGIQFNLERMASGADFDGLSARIEPNGKLFSNFDMFLNMIESADGIRIDVDYNADVLDRRTVERWIGHFATLAAGLATDMERPVRTLSVLTDTEKHWLIDNLNETAADYDRHAFMFSLLAQQAAAHPERIAAQHDGRTMTYRELEARSNRLARHIRSRVEGSRQRVALLSERSLDMLVAMIAIMKSGHAYVPLDPAHPEARLRQTLETARPAAILGDASITAGLVADDVAVIRFDMESPAIDAGSDQPVDVASMDPEAPAYVIFTSGSTGVPKGVEVSHRALVNFLTSMAREPGISKDDVLVAVTTIAFDIAGLELYLPLTAGARVVIANRTDVQDGFALVKLMEETQATVLQATPTLWQLLVEAGVERYPGLKMLCGGEPLSRDLARVLVRSGRELWNMYGPTETTIWSSVQKVADDDAPITIGHPIANTQLYILDQTDQIAPVGIVGELCIGGDGLANGYFDRPDLTKAAFVSCDIGTGTAERLYRTGDVGRRLPDGSLQLLGRRDNQIKLRGFRIELGDIESVVSAIEGVKQCAVVPVRDAGGDLVLVCYFTAEPGADEPTSATLTKHAQAHLPGHMVPAFWTMIGEFPQTANGKLDRNALVSRGMPERRSDIISVPPRTPMERKISAIWREVLRIDGIGVEDNIYALGADSLSIFRIAARMMDSGLALEAKHLLRHPSIAELAEFAENREPEASVPTYQIPSLKDFRNGARRRVEATS
ncbi:MAG: amino acid adenylation domain-containing protein [Rhizobium sp.]|nr:amino acid adenylation domain-containing protein [Rhizobium sp.]